MSDRVHPGEQAWVDHMARMVASVRLCPACGLEPAAVGDRHCVDCGSSADRSAWVEGPNLSEPFDVAGADTLELAVVRAEDNLTVRRMAEDPPASDEEVEHYAAVEAADRPARLAEFGLRRDECE